MAKAVTDLNVIKSDTDTEPQGAEFRGEYVQWGTKQKKVFWEKYEVAEQRAIVDPHTSGPMYKRGAGGTVLNSVMKERVVLDVLERDFILVDQGNGQVTKHYQFRTSPEELAARARQKRREAALDQLLDKVADTPGGLDALFGDDETPEYPLQKAAGWWE